MNRMVDGFVNVFKKSNFESNFEILKQYLNQGIIRILKNYRQWYD